MKRLLPLLTLILIFNTAISRDSSRTVRLLQTSDVHGNFFPYNFITRKPWEGSMARVATYVDFVRQSAGSDKVVLLDNGDILQGQPTVYYYNYIDTLSPHIAAEIYKFLGYDAATIGNHDIETGHEVYDRFIAQSPCPVMGANVIDSATGEPYLKPYTVIDRGGVRIAVLGLLTPAIPAWLPENLWSGLQFEDMVESAAKWVPIILEKEKPDVMVGLFHSGHDANTHTAGFMENASEEIARRVAGFDIVAMGHDHQRYNKLITGPDGRQVVVVNPANNANHIADITITVSKDSKGNLLDKQITGVVVPIGNLRPDSAFMERFAPDANAVGDFVSRKIGTATGDFSTRESFFGPSAFMTLLHRLQLEIADAEISFAAPLSFDAEIDAGDIRVSDMFTLYKYENLLYTMELTGREIKDYLEMVYSLWTNQIDPAATDPHIISFESANPQPGDNRLKYPTYNFDSAAGINYTVDVTRPKGEKVTILSMADGTPFDPDRHYRVAVNSYRGNGGGDLLTKGAGIPRSELKNRIIAATDKDLRYYLLKTIEKKGVVEPEIDNNWKFIPEDIASEAARRDSVLLFSGSTSYQK